MPDTDIMMVNGSGKLNVEKDLNYTVAKMMSEESGCTSGRIPGGWLHQQFSQTRLHE